MCGARHKERLQREGTPTPHLACTPPAPAAREQEQRSSMLGVSFPVTSFRLTSVWCQLHNPRSWFLKVQSLNGSGTAGNSV